MMSVWDVISPVTWPCLDVNECEEQPGICGIGTCVNKDGNFSCICPDGHIMLPDGHTCMGQCSHRLCLLSWDWHLSCCLFSLSWDWHLSCSLFSLTGLTFVMLSFQSVMGLTFVMLSFQSVMGLTFVMLSFQSRGIDICHALFSVCHGIDICHALFSVFPSSLVWMDCLGQVLCSWEVVKIQILKTKSIWMECTDVWMRIRQWRKKSNIVVVNVGWKKEQQTVVVNVGWKKEQQYCSC